jgi:DNA mismatch repair protein MSH6
MPPKHKASSDSLNQKSLTSFFGKGPAVSTKPPPTFKTPASKAKTVVEGKTPSASSGSLQKNASELHHSSSPNEPKTPDLRFPDAHALNSSAAPSSVVSFRHMSSPPTSDPIDVDMVSSDAEHVQASSVKSVRQLTLDRRVDTHPQLDAGQPKAETEGYH